MIPHQERGEASASGYPESCLNHALSVEPIMPALVTSMPGADRDDQRWDLADQTVADGQQRIGFGGVADAEALLHHADDDARR